MKLLTTYFKDNIVKLSTESKMLKTLANTSNFDSGQILSFHGPLGVLFVLHLDCRNVSVKLSQAISS